MWRETGRIFLESSEKVLHAAARVLPSVLAMLLFFALATAAGLLVRWAVRRACGRISLDQRLREWGVAGADGRGSPSRLVASASLWTVLLAGGFLGLSVLQAPGASALSLRLVEYLPRALLALVILGVGVTAGRFVERSVLIGAVNTGLHSARMLSLGARALVVTLAVAVALEHAGVGGGVVILAFGILFGGIVLSLALAIGLGAKDVVARSLERRFREGAEGAGEDDRPSGRLHHL
jgi:hypothetical protein